MAESQKKTINFEKMTFEEKKRTVLNLIMKCTNFNDPSATTLNWSTETMPLFVKSKMVLSFVHLLNYSTICADLKGEMTPEEVVKVVFRF